MLFTDESGSVAELAQGVDDVVAIIFEREAPVSEADHPIGVRVLSGEEARTASRARRGGAERLVKEHALVG
jgi:hypothetical protein